MRLVGQAFEISVPLGAEAFDEADLLAAFNAAHERIYRMPVDPRRAVEIVSYRLGLHVTRAELPALAGPPRLTGPVRGPLLIEDSTASLWVPPGWRAEEDTAGNLLLTRDA
jgi:N-methylhydantoinase A